MELSTAFKGLTAYKVQFERTVNPKASSPPEEWHQKGRCRRAFGRAIVIDPKVLQIQIYPFFELIHRSFVAGTPNFVRVGPNLGTTVAEFIYGGGGPEIRDLEHLDAERAASAHEELTRVIFACNTLQAGFVRSNGFVVCPKPGGKKPEFVCKPQNALGLNDRQFIPLGKVHGTKERPDETFDGRYDIIEIAPKVRVRQLKVKNHKPHAEDDLPDLAICSPMILESGRIKVPEDILYCSKRKDQTIGNEVNWDPANTCTSFTAIGVTETRRVVAVSMFESLRGERPASDRGITATEMAWLLTDPVLGCTDGVIGGGSADVQQYLDVTSDTHPALLEAPPRFKRPGEESVKVVGARGLGAILAVLQR